MSAELEAPEPMTDERVRVRRGDFPRCGVVIGQIQGFLRMTPGAWQPYERIRQHQGINASADEVYGALRMALAQKTVEFQHGFGYRIPITVEIAETTLDGATERGPENSWPANAGEFAARWNAQTPEKREEWTRALVRDAEASLHCALARHDDMVKQVGAERILDAIWRQSVTDRIPKHVLDATPEDDERTLREDDQQKIDRWLDLLHEQGQEALEGMKRDDAEGEPAGHAVVALQELLITLGAMPVHEATVRAEPAPVQYLPPIPIYVGDRVVLRVEANETNPVMGTVMSVLPGDLAHDYPRARVLWKAETGGRPAAWYPIDTLAKVV